MCSRQTPVAKEIKTFDTILRVPQYVLMAVPAALDT